jgi:hypothetical protein
MGCKGRRFRPLAQIRKENVTKPAAIAIVVFSFLALAAPVAEAQKGIDPWTGSWLGQLSADGNNLRVVFNISSSGGSALRNDGHLRARLNPDIRLRDWILEKEALAQCPPHSPMPSFIALVHRLW